MMNGEVLRTTEEDMFLIRTGHTHEWLAKNNFTLLADNQLTTTLEWKPPHKQPKETYRWEPGVYPGVVCVSLYPPNTSHFGYTYPLALIELKRQDKTVPLALDKDTIDWHPHRLVVKFTGPSGELLREELCIADDTVYCTVKLENLEADDVIVVRGQPFADDVKELKPWGKRGLHAAVSSNGAMIHQYVSVSASDNGVEIKEGQYSWSVPAKQATEIEIVAALHREKLKAAFRVREGRKNIRLGFEQASQRWKRFFEEEAPRLVCSDRQLMEIFYTSLYILRADRYDGGVTTDLDFPYVVPSKWTWRGIWPEDLAHAITGLTWLNEAETVSGCLRTIFQHQFRPDAGAHEKVHAYGLLTIAAWHYYKKTGDNLFLQEVFPNLCAMSDFLASKLDADEDGLVSMKDSFHLGWDSSLRFDYSGNLVEKRYFKDPLEPVDANSYYCAQSKILSQMAKKLSDEAAENKFNKRAQKTKEALQKYAWDEESGMYYDLFASSNEHSKVKTCAGLFPMLAKVPSERQVEKLIALMTDPEEFWTRYPLGCTAQSEQASKGWGWSGATCLRNNWLAVEGLSQYGRNETLRELVKRTLDIYRRYRPKEMWKDYYTRPTSGDVGNSHLGILFSTPVAGQIDMIVRWMGGVQPQADGTIKFDPVALNKELDFFGVSNLTVQGKSVEIRWHKPDTKNPWDDDAEGYRVYVDGLLQ